MFPAPPVEPVELLLPPLLLLLATLAPPELLLKPPLPVLLATLVVPPVLLAVLVAPVLLVVPAVEELAEVAGARLNTTWTEAMECSCKLITAGACTVVVMGALHVIPAMAPGALTFVQEANTSE